MKDIDTLIKDLPDKAAAHRFAESMLELGPSVSKQFESDTGLLSDLLTLAAYSPLLSTTILQNPKYVQWLKRERSSTTVKEKEEMLESLARFAMTNSTLERGVMLARFRRRELIRIYLKDIRGLGTIAEITAEISNLADAILEYALREATQKLDNQYGLPLATDDKGKQIRASFCVIALGKLGSKELNYSSDIDLLFLYSHEGSTSGQGSRGATSNREYFVKLAETASASVGQQTGEGAAYRVDTRLRPHGRVGTLAICVDDAIRYYHESARVWERQVLIRSRACAGDYAVFDEFIEGVRNEVFSPDFPVDEALRNVRRSKEQIDAEKGGSPGYDVKLGKGGIREIEFIAQALQLAYGGNDKWLRDPHTLISLTRLSDRGFISETELTSLFEAYKFLRRLEHRLQMEHGIQTHTVPDDLEKRLLISQRMGIHFVADFNSELDRHTSAVHKTFLRVFGEEGDRVAHAPFAEIALDRTKREDRELGRLFHSITKSRAVEATAPAEVESLKLFSKFAPEFSRMLTANPRLVASLPKRGEPYTEPDLAEEFVRPVLEEETFAARLSAIRQIWSRLICGIAAFDIYGEIDLETCRHAQTLLAEASLSVAVEVARGALEAHFHTTVPSLPIAVMGLGKLGGDSMDYGSDLDLILVYDESTLCPVPGKTHGEFYSKAAEYFTRTLSSITRDGSVYRVDLRLRPDGKNGPTVIGNHVFIEYLKERAAVWELLAYTKLRGVHSGDGFAHTVENEARRAIHERAVEADSEQVRRRSFEIRQRLETEKTRNLRSNEIDIKFGEGGLQDVYFAIRYLQLRDDIPDDQQNRSTLVTLDRLRSADSLSIEDYMRLKHGYGFLRVLDHQLRLISGRSNRLLVGDRDTNTTIANRMGIESVEELLAQLSTHRINIRDAFLSVFEMSQV